MNFLNKMIMILTFRNKQQGILKFPTRQGEVNEVYVWNSKNFGFNSVKEMQDEFDNAQLLCGLMGKQFKRDTAYLTYSLNFRVSDLSLRFYYRNNNVLDDIKLSRYTKIKSGPQPFEVQDPYKGKYPMKELCELI